MTSEISKFAAIQKIGRSLMLPIAVLPVAAILLRLGQDDIIQPIVNFLVNSFGLNAETTLSAGNTIGHFIGSAGGAIFSNLGILFAIGIAVGFAKENNGAAGLAGAVGFFIVTESMKVIVHPTPEMLAAMHIDTVDAFKAKAASQMSIPIGVVVGLISGALYNRFKDIKLPDFLAFFGGRRFVPIVTGFVCLFVALVFGLCYPWLADGLNGFSNLIYASGGIGLFIYGILNRLLLVTGLHHIINSVMWFMIGSFPGKAGIVTGDLNRFFAGDPTAGAFMTGFFPVMMFGLPAACLAMYMAASKERRPMVGGVLMSMALTSFLTGITEPIEFSFMFLAPVLYVFHAIMTGLGLVIMNLLHVKLGFGFSAGLFDAVINWNKSTNPESHPWLLIPVGIAYFAIYYGVFYFFIKKFDLKLIGRDDVAATAEVVPTQSVKAGVGKELTLADKYITALGGAENIRNVDSCTTRMRLEVVDNNIIDVATLKALGARGVLKPTIGAVQVIIGPQVDQIVDQVKDALGQIVK